jgi:asparagine synthase (glutamine-hydrolysing)
MCGISGILDLKHRTAGDVLRAEAKQMASALRHRGPDDEGVWSDPDAGVALAHRRLSIIDLTSCGHQPMVSASGRYVITFNGEVYNFQALRRQLSSSYPFRGHSDTEVMLACIERWGLEGSLARWNGMFAFALWDCHDRVLYLGRDRFGEKPLYYGEVGGKFLFGSELKAIRAHPSFEAKINRNSIALYLRHNCIPAPNSIYEGIYKLPPAAYLPVRLNVRSDFKPVSYWSLLQVVERGAAARFSGREGEAIEELDALLRDAVKIRMEADVPLGVFLSGGIDSSVVTALMQIQSERPVRSFSIGFDVSEYNEADNAAAVARHLGTDHTELYVTPEQALAVIPRLPTIYDEPFADASQIPTYLLSQLTRQHVTVALSGDGGDEMFGGYNRHVWATQLERAIKWIPKTGRNALASMISSVSSKRLDSLCRCLEPVLPNRLKLKTPGYKLHKLASTLLAKDGASAYLSVTSHWHGPASIAIGSTEPKTLLGSLDQWLTGCSLAEQMMYMDSLTYLPDDILTKVDRATMAVSLEARVPFLDHRIAEFAWQLPSGAKVRNGKGKWILREVLRRYLPPGLVERPKAGFGIPIDRWLRGPLRDWAEELLNEGRLETQGFFRPAPIREMWSSHLAGRGAWQYHLWDVLMFQAWLEQNGSILRRTEDASAVVS